MKTVAQVLDITQHKRMEADRKRFEERLSALNTYSQELNMAESMEEIYELTLDAAEKTLGFEFADILIIEGKMLCLVAHRGYSKNLSLKLPLDGDKGITVRAARTGKPVFVPDISREKAYVEGGEDIRSELAVPIKIRHRVLGVLNVESKNLDAFDERDRKLLEILASHSATAISNLKHAKNLEAYAQAIRENQEKFKRLFMDNPEAAVYLGPDFHILDVNPRFEQLFGYPLDQIKGKHIDDVVAPKDKMKEAEMLNKKATEGYIYHDTVRKRKDGTLVPVSISAAPITIEGQLVGHVGLYKDVTERRQMEEKLRESEEKYRKQFEEAMDAIFVADAETGIIIDCNRAASELIGREKSELIGKHQRILHPPQEIEGEFSRAFKQHLKEKEGQILETRVITKKGEIREITIKANVFELKGKKIIQGIFRDITEQKKAEEALRRTEEQARALNTYSRNLNMADNMEEIYRLTLDAMEKTLGFEHASFMIVDKDALCIVDQRGYPGSLSMKLPLNGTKRGVTVKAAKTCRSVLVPDTKKERDYVEGMPNIRSELAVPIKLGDRVLGVLNVESKKSAAFDARDRRLLEILASHAATAIRNFRYARKLQELVQEVRKRSDELAALMKSSTEIIHTTDLRQRLKVIAEAIRELGWRRVVISPRDENLETTDIVTAGLTQEEVKTLWVKKSPGRVWRERLGPKVQPYKIGEFYYLPWKDSWVRKYFWGVPSGAAPEEAVEYIAGVPSRVSPEEMIDWHPQDTLYAPLRLPEGRIVGILSIDDPLDGRRPTKESLAPLELFVHQAAVAIENAQLIEDLETARNQVKEHADKLELKVEERTRELVESEKKYSTLVEHANDGVVIIQDGRLSFVNKRVEEMTGYSREELIGKPFLNMISESEVELVKSRYEERMKGKPVPSIYEVKAMSKNGEVIPIEVNVALINYGGKLADLVVVRDISERKKMEEKLLKTEKLAAIGELAASVGHDLRNPLTGIGGAVYYLKMKLASQMNKKSREMLTLIENDIQYSNKIVNDLLDFSGEIRLRPVETSAKSMITETLSKIKVPKDVKILDSTGDTPRLFVDADHMERVFQNLITNAIEAMPNGGKLEIKSKKIKNSLKLTFKDTGTGISKSNRNKLFTPLFTTKAKGVGMGLAICKRIIDAHGGSINVESKERVGTRFTVTIPLEGEIKNINR